MSKRKETMILALFIVMSLLLCRLFVGFIPSDKGILIEIENEHNRAVVKYKSAFVYAPNKIKILYGSKSSWFFIKHKTIRTTIENEGISLNESNYKYRWADENTLLITLSGKCARTYTIHFDKQ